jgi:hypothetical protein
MPEAVVAAAAPAAQAAEVAAVETAHPVITILQDILLLLIGEGAEVLHGTDTVPLLEVLVDPVSSSFGIQICMMPQNPQQLHRLYPVDIEFTDSLAPAQLHSKNNFNHQVAQ